MTPTWIQSPWRHWSLLTSISTPTSWSVKNLPRAMGRLPYIKVPPGNATRCRLCPHVWSRNGVEQNRRNTRYAGDIATYNDQTKVVGMWMKLLNGMPSGGESVDCLLSWHVWHLWVCITLVRFGQGKKLEINLFSMKVKFWNRVVFPILNEKCKISNSYLRPYLITLGLVFSC